MALVDEEIQAGASVTQAWRQYARRAPYPLRYQAFALRYRQYLASLKPLPDIAPGVPTYLPKETEAVEKYWADRADPSSCLYVLAGFGCSLKVEHGMLIASDTGTIRKFEPSGHRLSAIIFGPFGGLLTTNAIQWCADRGISIMTLDYHGRMVSVTAPFSAKNVALRRAQFGADAINVARRILIQKLSCSLRIGRQSEFVYGRIANQIDKATTVETLLQLEATAAGDYWNRWQFPLKHKPRGWPASWSEFSYRTSMLSGSPQHATHPVNAMLNYAYSIIVGLCARSLCAAGFDPSIGFLHVDRDGRYSLAYDLLELLRADIDHAILSWVSSQRWSRADFPVTKSGIVRVHPDLTRVVMQRTIMAVPPGQVDKAAAWLVDVVTASA